MEHLSRALANKVGGALHYPPEQIEVLAYGFFGLLQTAFLLAGTALLGWAIGAFWPCLAAVLAGSLLRRFAGGAHASTPGRCALITLLVCGAAALAATLLARSVSRPPLLAAYLASCALCLAVVGARAPVDSPNKPLPSKERCQKLRRGALTVVGCYTAAGAAALVFGSGPLPAVAVAVLLAVLWQVLTLTRLGGKLLGRL